jgi:hypothetical protein
MTQIKLDLRKVHLVQKSSKNFQVVFLRGSIELVELYKTIYLRTVGIFAPEINLQKTLPLAPFF